MLVKFEVYYDGEYWCARGIEVDIFTQGKSLDDLMENIKALRYFLWVTSGYRSAVFMTKKPARSFNKVAIDSDMWPSRYGFSAITPLI